MKLVIEVKDPDGIHESVRQAVEDDLAKIEGLTDDERRSLMDDRVDRAFDSVSRWVKYQEYMQIEIDTEADTATVIPYP